MANLKLDILAFAAHPDDVELSCVGTLIKQVKLGNTVGIIDFTLGEMGTRGTVEQRKEEAQASAKLMGASVREMIDLGDSSFQNSRKEQLAIIQKIRKYQPDIVLTNALDDRHPDHGRGAALLKDAAFFSGLRKIETKDDDGKAQQAWRPRLVLNYIQSKYIQPDIVVDITEEWDKKMECILAFKSQFYNPESKEPETYISSPGFLDLIKARAIELGNLNGFKYAEGFTMQYAPGVKDLMKVF